jgi:hypothetical protein
MRRAIFAVLVVLAFAGAAHAVSLRQVMRDCGDDSRAYCKDVGYGQPMQACLASNRAKLTDACRAIVERLEKGEKVGIFG